MKKIMFLLASLLISSTIFCGESIEPCKSNDQNMVDYFPKIGGEINFTP